MGHTLLFENKTIHYTDEGRGDCLVLLHGFLESLQIWKEFVKELNSNFRVICIDLPGHGNSDCIEETHTMRLMANVVYSVLEYLDVKQCVMIGHSMGGYVTLQFAEQFQEKLKGFGLFHSHGAADSDEAKINRERTINIVQKDHLDFISSFIPDLFAPENIQKFNEEIIMLKEYAKLTPKKGIIAAIKGMKDRTSKLHLLLSTKLPVLFLHGKEDQRIPVEIIKEQFIMPAHVEILLLDHVGHMGFIEARYDILNTIKYFANKIYSK